MRILRRDQFRTMPWKNGGGETTEIAVFPDGAGMDDFAWRVSMARVAADGPFSVFPEIDRSLTLLEGEGMVLRIAGRDDQRLTVESPPYAFPGDAATEGLLEGGPILDLNVMTRRGVCRAEVQRRTDPRLIIDPSGATVLALVRGGTSSAGGETINDGDVLRLEPDDEPVAMVLAAGNVAFEIRIR